MTAPVGYQPPPSAPSRKHRAGRTALFGCLGFVGLVVLIIIIAAVVAATHSGSKTGTAADGTSPQTGSAPAPARLTSLGNRVRDGSFQFVITRITRAKSVGATSLGLGDTAQGEYTILHVTVTNIGNQAQTLDDSAQYVYDSHGRKYDASTSADLDINGGTSGGVFLNSINPGNTVHGRIAFDLPVGDRAVKAELHDSMFSGGVTVSLKK